jgi:hypothetical protein
MSPFDVVLSNAAGSLYPLFLAQSLFRRYNLILIFSRSIVSNVGMQTDATSCPQRGGKAGMNSDGHCGNRKKWEGLVEARCRVPARQPMA